MAIASYLQSLLIVRAVYEVRDEEGCASTLGRVGKILYSALYVGFVVLWTKVYEFADNQ